MASSPSCTRNLTWSDRVRRWTSPLACVALFAASLFCPTTASAQPDYGDGAAYDYESDVDFSLPFDDHSGSVSAVPEPEDHGVGGYGVKGRAGHIVGDTVGRNDSITYFDMSPYAFFDDTMLFGEGRLFIANNGRVGGSAGLGLRRFFSEKNLIGGASFWYDRDDSRGPTFEQLGLSTEMLSEWLDWRTNIYFQIGQDLAITRERVENGTEMFVGQNIAFQRRTFAANTMQGMDMMFTVPVPGELPQRNNLELSAGWYMFEAPDYPIEDVYGWKLRLDGDILDRLSHMFVEYTSDATFKNNIIFGVDVNYWHTLESRPRLGRSQYNRMASWVRRNRTVTVTETSFLQAPELAINPVTGQPYLVYHVRNRPDGALPTFPAPAGDGSLEMPFQYVNEAIAETPDADLIFVHANSVFDGDPNVDGGNAPIDLSIRDNVTVLGEFDTAVTANRLTLDIANPGLEDPTIFLPNATPDALMPRVKPRITNIDGVAAVTLGNGSRIGGFTIDNVNGAPAILGSMINGSRIDQVDISDTTGTGAHGLSLLQTTGRFGITGLTVDNVAGNGFNFIGDNGISSTITVEDSIITNAAGFSAFIQDLNGSAVMNTLSINPVADPTMPITGGLGIFVGSSALDPVTAIGTSTATVQFGATRFNGTNAAAAAPAINVFRHGGRVEFRDELTIVQNNGDAISVFQLQAPGLVSFANTGFVTIEDRNAHGIRVFDTQELPVPTNPTQAFAGRVEFRGPVTIDTPIPFAVSGNTDPAILFQVNSGTLRFDDNVTINGSNGVGIEITDIINDPVFTSINLGRADAFFRGTATSSFSINDTLGISMFVHDVEKANFVVNTNDVDINNRSVQGFVVSDYDGDATFAGINNVDNGNNVAVTAVEILRNGDAIANQANPLLFNDIFFANLSVEDALGPIQPPVFRGPQPGPFGVNINQNASRVGFNDLNVETTGAVGVSIIDNLRVTTGGGDLDATNARAIQAFRNGFLNLEFTSVNADNSDYGIIISNDQLNTIANVPGNAIRILDPAAALFPFGDATFRVTGTGALGSGGQIAGMVFSGAFFDEIQVVDLDSMEFDDNFIGIELEDIINRGGPAARIPGSLGFFGNQPLARIENTIVEDSISFGISTLDVRTFELVTSQVLDNGRPLGDEQIFMLVTQATVDDAYDGLTPEIVPTYSYLFDGNLIQDAPGQAIVVPNTNPFLVNDMVFIATLVSDPVPLELRVLNNGSRPNGAAGFQSNRLGTAGFAIDWEGDVDAAFRFNQFTLLPGNNNIEADDQDAVDLVVDGSINLLFDNNTITSAGSAVVPVTNHTGIRVTASDPSFVNISRNLLPDPNNPNVPLPQSGFFFDVPGSVAVELDLRGANNTVIIGEPRGNQLNGNLFEFGSNAFQSIVVNNTFLGAGTSFNMADNFIGFAALNNVNFGQQRVVNFNSVGGPISLNSGTTNFTSVGGNIGLLLVTPTTIGPPNFVGSLLFDGFPVP